MHINNCELNILVNGRAVSEFKSPMDFQHYIEGRDGSTFEIELVNNNNHDCEFIVSVDGLSITDGKAAGEQSGGYMIPANSRRAIPGWMVDGATAAKFTFSGAKGTSYAEQAEEGDARNKGVIGAKVFARKQSYSNTFTVSGGNLRGMRSISKSASSRGARGMSGPMFGGAEPKAGGAWTGTSTLLGSSDMSFQNCVASASASPTSFDASEEVYVAGASIEPEVEQTLGTSFGEATKFDTTTVQFERGDMIAMIVLYYDDRQGLKRRGIDVTRKLSAPSPFPADEPKGCQPPANWQR